MTLLGTSVGHYRIVDLIGQGGMGEVYVGFDETLQRKVALKSIRPEHRLDSQARVRFLREARILSQLQHPRICQIHDYIEGEQRDFLVLELVQGRSLREAMKQGLDPALKMRVAEQVAEVLVAAHGKGVIHRDLKPENVMLTPEDQVKVLDFGLARSIAGRPIAPTVELREAPPGGEVEPPAGIAAEEGEAVTTLGTIVGSVGYMSPEQARGEPATAASDMYSFGLTLQELFMGEPAYDRSLDTATRLEQARKGETRPVTGLDPDLTALIERLEAVPPPARPSALDTAERLRWIREKPRRRRQRLLVSGAMAALTLLALGLAVQSCRAAREAERANREAEAARQVSRFLVDLFEVSAPERSRGSTITARELLDRGAERIARELADQPLTQATLMDAMGVIYEKLGLYDQAEPLLEKALTTRERLLGPTHPQVADTCHNLGRLYRYARMNQAKAEALLRRALVIREAALGPEHADLARTLVELGTLLFNLKESFTEAEAHLRRALAIQEKVFGPEGVALTETLDRLGFLYYLQAKLAEAESLHNRALAIRERALGSDHLEVGFSLDYLAGIHSARGRYGEAEALYERALRIFEKAYGPEHRAVAAGLNNLADVRTKQGDYAGAESLHARALAIREKVLGPDHPDVAASLFELAGLQLKHGRYAEAERLYERARSILEKAFGPEDGRVALTLNGLAEAYRAWGRYGQAEPLYKRALGIREKRRGPEHPAVAESLTGLADLYRQQGRSSEAEALYQRALAIFEKALGDGHPSLAGPLAGLAILRRDARDYDAAEPLFRRALAIQERSLGEAHPDVRPTAKELAVLLRATGRADEAAALDARASRIPKEIPAKGIKR